MHVPYLETMKKDMCTLVQEAGHQTDLLLILSVTYVGDKCQ